MPFSHLPRSLSSWKEFMAYPIPAEVSVTAAMASNMIFFMVFVICGLVVGYGCRTLTKNQAPPNPRQRLVFCFNESAS